MPSFYLRILVPQLPATLTHLLSLHRIDRKYGWGTKLNLSMIRDKIGTRRQSKGILVASIELQGHRWRIVFRYNGEKYQRTLETRDREEAQHLRSRVEENLKLLRRGRLEYQAGDDLVTLLMSDGRLNVEPRLEKQRTLGSLLKDYRREAKVGKGLVSKIRG